MIRRLIPSQRAEVVFSDYRQEELRLESDPSAHRSGEEGKGRDFPPYPPRLEATRGLERLRASRMRSSDRFFLCVRPLFHELALSALPIQGDDNREPIEMNVPAAAHARPQIGSRLPRLVQAVGGEDGIGEP